MITRVFRGAKMVFNCTSCGRKHIRSIPWVKTHRQIACSCGTSIDVTSMRDGLFGIGLAAPWENLAQKTR